MAEESAAAAASEDARDKSPSGGSSSDPQVEARARRMGWMPETEFDPATMKRAPREWLSPQDYIEKVETNLPIMRERLRNYDDVVVKQEEKLSEITKELKTNNERVADLGKLVEDLHSQNQVIGKRAYETAKRDLERAQRLAVSEADEATYDEATRRLAELERHKPEDAPKPKKTAADEDDAPAKTKTETQPAAPQLSRDAKEWIDENQTIMTDPIMNPVAVSLHTRNMASGLSEKESLAKLQGQIKAEFPHKFNDTRREAPSTVASSSPQGRTAKKQTFDSLPSDAKQTYERLAKYMASKGKPYTKETYAKDYYLEQEGPQS